MAGTGSGQPVLPARARPAGWCLPPARQQRPGRADFPGRQCSAWRQRRNGGHLPMRLKGVEWIQTLVKRARSS